MSDALNGARKYGVAIETTVVELGQPRIVRFGLWLLSAGIDVESRKFNDDRRRPWWQSRGFQATVAGLAAYRRALITSAIAQPTMGAWLTARCAPVFLAVSISLLWLAWRNIAPVFAH